MTIDNIIYFYIYILLRLRDWDIHGLVCNDKDSSHPCRYFMDGRLVLFTAPVRVPFRARRRPTRRASEVFCYNGGQTLSRYHASRNVRLMGVRLAPCLDIGPIDHGYLALDKSRVYYRYDMVSSLVRPWKGSFIKQRQPEIRTVLPIDEWSPNSFDDCDRGIGYFQVLTQRLTRYKSWRMRRLS